MPSLLTCRHSTSQLQDSYHILSDEHLLHCHTHSIARQGQINFLPFTRLHTIYYYLHTIYDTLFIRNLRLRQIQPLSTTSTHHLSFVHKLSRQYLDYLHNIYRVFSKGRNAVGPSKSLIFWTFVKLRQGSGKERQGKARKGKERQVWRKVKGLKA